MVLAGQLYSLAFSHTGWLVHPGAKREEEGDRNSSKEVKRGDGMNEEVGPRSGHPKFLRTCKSLGGGSKGGVWY